MAAADTHVDTPASYEPAFPAWPFYAGEYDPAYCPSTRAGHETQHTCSPVDRATCPAPASWEDHCHVYSWFTEYQAGNAARLDDLVRYYRRRAAEVLQRKFHYLEPEEGHAIGLEALMLVLMKYDPTMGVPAQAYLRKWLPARITDRLRDEGAFSRAAADFDKKLHEVMEANPELSEGQAAQLVVGTPDRHSTFTSARVQDLMRERQMREALRYEYAGDDGSEFGARALVDAHDTLDEVISRETAANAAKVVGELTKGLDPADVELVLAYTAGGAAVTAWAQQHGMSRPDASARAQALLSRLQGRAAELLNVSKATLANRTFDRNEEKFLEAMNTGRITAVGDALVDVPAPTWELPAARGTVPETSSDDDHPVLFS